VGRGHSIQPTRHFYLSDFARLNKFDQNHILLPRIQHEEIDESITWADRSPVVICVRLLSSLVTGSAIRFSLTWPYQCPFQAMGM
jgi:hypothetical protein